jgi:hypothetical protein
MSAAVAFGPTANPDAYVPWTGSERALAELTHWARGAGPPLCVLSGPPGMGKTLLLKLLAARTRERLRSLYLAYPDCDRGALCSFVLQGLDLGALDDSAESLVEALRTNAGPPVLLLIDEGELLPLDTVACLREVAAGAAGKLRVAIAVTREERREELLAALGDDAQSVAIEGAMSKAEVAAHVRTQLSRAAIDPKIGERFDGATLARLHASSEGVPASLQSLAAALLFEAQRARGEIRIAPRAAPEEPRADEAPKEPAVEKRFVAPTAIPIPPMRPRPVPARRGRGAIFALGTALGIAGGLALAELGPRLLAERATPTAVESAPTPPPVAAPPPAAAVAPTPVAPAPAPPPPVVAARPQVAEPAATAPSPVTVTVSFNSDPWAYIEVDGQRIGATPIAAHPLVAGRHRVTATLADGRTVEREVDVDGERNRRIVFP